MDGWGGEVAGSRVSLWGGPPQQLVAMTSLRGMVSCVSCSVSGTVVVSAAGCLLTFPAYLLHNELFAVADVGLLWSRAFGHVVKHFSL